MKNLATHAGIVLALALGIFPTSPAYPLGPSGHLEPTPDELNTSNVCLFEAASGEFSTSQPVYKVKGTCFVNAKYVTSAQGYRGESTFDDFLLQAKIPWSAVGTYNPATKETREQISLLKELPRARPDNPPLYQEVAKVVTTMVCAVDPWLDQTFSTCLKVTPQISGDASVLNTNNKLVQIDNSYVVGVLYPPSVHVPRTSQMPPPQRVGLQKQYAAAVAAAQRKGSDIRQATSQTSVASQIFVPAILAPLGGQRFYAQTVVPIRLAPPKDWSATNYLISLEMKDAHGKWSPVTSLTVPALQAQSKEGYTGFGAGPALLAVPGAWRLAAEVSSPRQSGWSTPVEFLVAPLPSPSTPAVGRRLTK